VSDSAKKSSGILSNPFSIGRLAPGFLNNQTMAMPPSVRLLFEALACVEKNLARSRNPLIGNPFLGGSAGLTVNVDAACTWAPLSS